MSVVERLSVGLERAPLVLWFVLVALVLVAGVGVASLDGTPTAQVATGEPTGSSSHAGVDATIRGGEADDAAGRSVASVGDVDGDGTADVLIGAPGTDADDDDAGAAALFYGPVDPDTVDLSAADATFSGESAGDRAGRAVAGAGDLNGDGHDDFVIGAPAWDGAGTAAGAVYVVFGGPNLSGEASLATAADVRLEGSVGARAGLAVDGSQRLGGQAGVLVGAPGATTSGTEGGVAYVVANDSLQAGDSLALATEASARLVGAPGAQAGWDVADAGDMTGDGIGDVVVGAPGHNGSAGARTGTAYVVPGPVNGTINLSTGAVGLVGEEAGDRAGFAVDGAGDVNGDGVTDLVVGAPFHDGAENRTDAGVAYVVFGGSDVDGELSLWTANVTLSGEAAGDRAGWSVAVSGREASCDDVADLAIGAPGTLTTGTGAGAVYYHAGNASLPGLVPLEEADATIRGASPGDQSGTAVAIGEANGDGRAVLLVGSPGVDANATTQDVGGVSLAYVDCRVGESGTGGATPTDSRSHNDAGQPVTETPVTTSGPASDADSDEPARTEAGTTAEGVETATGSTPTDGTATEIRVSTGAGGTDSDSADDAEGAGPVSPTASPTDAGGPSLDPVTADVVCERSTPYLYNPNDVSVDATVTGPRGTETHRLGPGIDVGGPAPPSYLSPALPPGDYTVTATGSDGERVPVNGETTYSTTVKRCPSAAVTLECRDDDTVTASFRATDLTGRHDRQVTIDRRPNLPGEGETTHRPVDGTVDETLTVSDGERHLLTASLAVDESPRTLARITVDRGECDHLAESGTAADGAIGSSNANGGTSPADSDRSTSGTPSSAPGSVTETAADRTETGATDTVPESTEERTDTPATDQQTQLPSTDDGPGTSNESSS